MEYLPVYTPGLYSTSFSMYSTTQGMYTNKASVYSYTCGVVEYRASENVISVNRLRLVCRIWLLSRQSVFTPESIVATLGTRACLLTHFPKLVSNSFKWNI